MNNYIDVYGRYHNQPVTEARPMPSNNAFIFSAYAKKAGLEVNIDKRVLEECTNNNLRHPKEVVYSYVPMSHDEILALSYFGYHSEQLKKDFSYSPFPIPKFSLLKLLSQLYQIRPSRQKLTVRDSKLELGNWHVFGLYLRHRNYFWENNLDQLYRFSFKLRTQDKAFVLKNMGKFRYYNPLHLFYLLYGKIQAKIGTPNSVDWLKYDGEGYKSMSEQFPSDNPIRIKMGV